MVEYKISYSKIADKDKKKLKNINLDTKALELIYIIRNDPFKQPPFYEKLRGDLENTYSRRINYQHRLVYEVNETTKEIFIIRMWSHYEKI